MKFAQQTYQMNHEMNHLIRIDIEIEMNKPYEIALMSFSSLSFFNENLFNTSKYIQTNNALSAYSSKMISSLNILMACLLIRFLIFLIYILLYI